MLPDNPVSAGLSEPGGLVQNHNGVWLGLTEHLLHVGVGDGGRRGQLVGLSLVFRVAFALPDTSQRRGEW